MELDFSHHAYLIEGDRELVLVDVHAAIEAASGRPVAGNPNFYFAEYDSFGIDESRDLKARQSTKGFAEGRKFLVVATRAFTAEAQNALLKVFEEPTPDTHFVIIMPDASHLLPTLRSRLAIRTHGAQAEPKAALEKAQKFLEGDLVGRMSVIKKMVEDKDKAEAQALVDALVRVMYKEFQKTRAPQLASALAETERYRDYISDRSPSVKMILEHLALTLPQGSLPASR